MNKIVDRFHDLSSSAAYSGINELQRVTGESAKNVRKALATDMTYSLYKPARFRFKRLSTVPTGFMQDVQCDLADMRNLSKENDGYAYCLVACDVMSRQIFAVPAKSKSSAHMRTAFDALLSKLPEKPSKIFTDKGTEFLSKAMLSYFKSKDIVKLNGENDDVKAAVCERAIRTLKSRLYKYFAAKNTTNWVNVLDKLTSAINRSYSRVLKARPVDVTRENWFELWKKLYGSAKRPKSKSYFNVGDFVRVVRKREAFDKGYLSNFTDEIFKIAKKHFTSPETFEIVDGNNNPIHGRYYAKEFSLTSAETLSRVEKIVKSQMRKGKLWHLVKWVGFKPVYNQWVPDEDIT